MKHPRYLLLCLAAGCGGSEAAPDGGALVDARAADAGPAMDASPPEAGPVVDAGDVPLMPPILLSAQVVVHGTIALAWSLPASGCTTITVNRKKDTAAYAAAQSVTGVATEVQDMPGHANGTYCYNLLCTLNGASSAPSNERCVTQ